MHQILKFVGFTVAGLATVVFAFLTGRNNFDPLIIGAVFPMALAAVVAGVLLAAFGAMLEHLIAIRYAVERQNRLTEQSIERLGR